MCRSEEPDTIARVLAASSPYSLPPVFAADLPVGVLQVVQMLPDRPFGHVRHLGECSLPAVGVPSLIRKRRNSSEHALSSGIAFPRPPAAPEITPLPEPLLVSPALRPDTHRNLSPELPKAPGTAQNFTTLTLPSPPQTAQTDPCKPSVRPSQRKQCLPTPTQTSRLSSPLRRPFVRPRPAASISTPPILSVNQQRHITDMFGTMSRWNLIGSPCRQMDSLKS